MYFLGLGNYYHHSDDLQSRSKCLVKYSTKYQFGRRLEWKSSGVCTEFIM